MNHHYDHTAGHRDPVCGMTVAPGDDSYTYLFENKTYFFCAEACRKEFKKSPGKYLKGSSFFIKRWWNNYLKRLRKVTNGKAPCCH